MRAPTGQQLRAARILAGLSCGELADLASIHIAYIIAAESEMITNEQAVASICRALESCGIEFGPEDWIRYRTSSRAVPQELPVSQEPPRNDEPEERGRELKPDKRLKREIGAACRRARESLALTQQAVGERIGISTEYYARIERGVSAPSTATLFVIAQVFGLDLDKLIKEGVGVTTPFVQPPETYQDFPVERFGAMCRRARKSRDLVQKEVADRLGVSPNFYARIERGDVVPSLAMLCRLVSELELDINELLRPNYVEAFGQLWGQARDVFAGVQRDERGIPVVDEED